jgi:hypothetical protein
MADVTLHDGREVSFDLDALTIREFRQLLDPRQKQEDEDAIICRVTGLEMEVYLSLSKADEKRLWAAFFKKVREPLADPNSASASSSQ